MKCFVTFSLIFFSLFTHAQKQNNTWCLGDKAGLNFNGGSPTPISTAMLSREGGASVSDRNTGSLLFYTDGVKVWNRANTVMPNGNGIGNDLFSSTMQGVVIVPFTSDSNKYYVFALEPESLSEGALFYSVVDMRLDGGKGDVVTSQKKVKLGDGFVEGMCAVATCDGHWLILSSREGNQFSAYKISASGLDTNAVVSQMPFPYTKTLVLAPIKVSPDNKKLVFASYKSVPASGQPVAIAAIFDFNERTGNISNGQYLLDPSTDATYYSIEFSGDASKLYLTDIARGVIQLDLSLSDPAAIKASRALIYQTQATRRAYTLQMAPDGNIYVAIEGAGILDRISNANAAVPNCMYTWGAVALSPLTASTQSLPPAVHFASPKSVDTTFTSTRADICRGSNIQLKGVPGALSYLWQDGSTKPEFTTPQDGKYWVKAQFICHEQNDTFNVQVVDLSINIGRDTTICTGQPLTVRAGTNDDSATFAWQDGSTADSFVISRAGTYWVTADLGPCIAYDTITVLENDSAYFQLPADTILCTGDTFNLYIPADVRIYNWSTGSKDSMITVKTAGKYFLQVTRGGCNHTDTIELMYAEPPRLGNDTLLCNGDEWALSGKSILNSMYLWNTGEVSDSIVVRGPGVYTVTVDNRCGIAKDSIQIDYKVCDCQPFIPNAFTPNNDGRNDKFGPMMKCRVESYEFIVVNRFGEVLFRTTDRQQKWDGTYKGQPCDVGNYYYLLRLKNVSGTDDLQKGNVLLIR